MKLRLVVALLAIALLTSACSRLGTGLPGCRTPASDPNAATVLSLQAVPEAEYAPCLNSLQLGWDEVEFQAERGLVTLDFEHGLDEFLQVRLTPSCDIGDAIEVPSELEGVSRYEDVFQVTDDIRVTIIPDGERPRLYANELAADLDGAHVDDRPVVFTVDQDIDFSVLSRVNKALFTDQYVWIINDLDIDEGTLEMRATSEGEGMRGIEVDDALDLIESMSDEIQYRGFWYFQFEGGCITYEFDAEGTLATSIAEDAEMGIGFYRSADLREAARNAGFDLVGEQSE